MKMIPPDEFCKLVDEAIANGGVSENLGGVYKKRYPVLYENAIRKMADCLWGSSSCDEARGLGGLFDGMGEDK